MKCINCKKNEAVKGVTLVFDGLCAECKKERYRISLCRPTAFVADDATAEHYGQTNVDDYIYSDEVSGAKPHRP